VGYVRRQRSKKDRRKILVRRTERDRALEGKYVEVSQQMTKLYYEGFTKNEIDRFEKDLARILNNLANFEEAHG
jgi:DNA-binding MarR family transcriptional regulator